MDEGVIILSHVEACIDRSELGLYKAVSRLCIDIFEET